MYDYIIVGGGSAGCVLASRLSENPSLNVCLLEAGPADRHPAIKLPLGMLWMMRSPRLNWNYYTRREKNLNHRKLFWPRGRTLGGSSASNAMIYIRGHREDYDSWADSGNSGWSFRELLPYFKKSQHQERGGSKYHGTRGPLNVQDIVAPSPVSNAFIQAGIAAGHQDNPDFNGSSQEGVGLYQLTQKKGRRCSTSHAFLAEAKKRPNLTVLTSAHVEKILFASGEGNNEENECLPKAVGIRYRRSGKEKVMQCRREVILASGAINSPHLLQLSGVGDREELYKHGIETVHHLPGVGKNLQDHLDVLLVEECPKKGCYGINWQSLLTRLPYHIYNYLFRNRGMFSSNGAEAGGFIKSSPDEKIPDLQFHFAPVKLKNHSLDWRFLIGHGYSLHVCNLRPVSRGSVSLKSADPQVAPEIDANYLDHYPDMEKMVLGVKKGLEILEQSPMAPYRGKSLSPRKPLQTDSDIRAFIRENAETIYHPVGTCKMGQDPMAVVNPRLQVHGIKGLRVVDASIMPTLVGGNTNAPVIAIAEKAVDMILANAGSDRVVRDELTVCAMDTAPVRREKIDA